MDRRYFTILPLNPQPPLTMRTSFLLIAIAPLFAVAQTFTPSLSLGNYPMGVFDMNADHLDDIVTPGTSTVHVRYQNTGGSGFTTVILPTPAANNTASWSFCAGDLDKNGYNDLLYGGGSGATFMMANGTGTGFTEVSFPQYIFCQRTNMVDFDSDGDLDAFVCHDVDTNVYFTNDGTGALTFHQGIFGSTGGNYGSIWVDYDNDNDQDIFIAKCGGDPVDIFMRNDGGMSFTSIAAANGFADTHQSWSSAWGDYDNDGDMDALVGSSSSPVHKFMRNDAGSFTNITIGSGFDTFGGQSIQWVTHDFDNDGWLDVLGGYGYLHNNGNMTFTPVSIAPDNGPIGDLNDDGFLDIVSGGTLYTNNGNSNHWLKVNTVGTVSNKNGIGARVTLISPSFTQIRDVRSGDGFSYMSSLNTHFGLGADAMIYQLQVTWPSGIVDIIDFPSVDTTLTVIEGASTGIAHEAPADQLKVYPNPANDVLMLHGAQRHNGERFSVVDLTGAEVLSGTVRFEQVDVSGLSPGAYVLRVFNATGGTQCRFVKQ